MAKISILESNGTTKYTINRAGHPCVEANGRLYVAVTYRQKAATLTSDIIIRKTNPIANWPVDGIIVSTAKTISGGTHDLPAATMCVNKNGKILIFHIDVNVGGFPAARTVRWSQLDPTTDTFDFSNTLALTLNIGVTSYYIDAAIADDRPHIFVSHGATSRGGATTEFPAYSSYNGTAWETLFDPFGFAAASYYGSICIDQETGYPMVVRRRGNDIDVARGTVANPTSVMITPFNTANAVTGGIAPIFLFGNYVNNASIAQNGNNDTFVSFCGRLSGDSTGALKPVVAVNIKGDPLSSWSALSTDPAHTGAYNASLHSNNISNIANALGAAQDGGLDRYSIDGATVTETTLQTGLSIPEVRCRWARDHEVDLDKRIDYVWNDSQASVYFDYVDIAPVPEPEPEPPAGGKTSGEKGRKKKIKAQPANIHIHDPTFYLALEEKNNELRGIGKSSPNDSEQKIMLRDKIEREQKAKKLILQEFGAIIAAAQALAEEAAIEEARLKKLAQEDDAFMMMID